MSTEEKIAYLAELRRLLQILPEDERNTALTYYEEYFDDAGMEETERVIGELGPARILADQILTGYGRGYLDTSPKSSHAQVPARLEDAAKARQEEEAHSHTTAKQADAKKSSAANTSTKSSGSSVLLTVILIILALPLLLPLVLTVFGLLIGLAALIFGLGLGLGGAVLALFLAGTIVLISGFGMMAIHFLEALLTCGIGLTLLGLGMLMLLLCWFMLIKVMPAVLRFLLLLVRWPFERRVARA
ncbi:MAG: hypothetical protein FWG61_09200 [Firmicutes bacterium]|nr:hypothetical protein [Bacillota bacterium]